MLCEYTKGLLETTARTTEKRPASISTSAASRSHGSLFFFLPCVTYCCLPVRNLVVMVADNYWSPSAPATVRSSLTALVNLLPILNRTLAHIMSIHSCLSSVSSFLLVRLVYRVAVSGLCFYGTSSSLTTKYCHALQLHSKQQQQQERRAPGGYRTCRKARSATHKVATDSLDVNSKQRAHMGDLLAHEPGGVFVSRAYRKGSRSALSQLSPRGS